MTTPPVALITGGTRGIGLGIARSLAREGFDLAVCGVREASAVTGTIAELQTLGQSVLYCQCDVGSVDARKAMLESIENGYGKLNILAINAGVAPPQRLDILLAT